MLVSKSSKNYWFVRLICALTYYRVLWSVKYSRVFIFTRNTSGQPGMPWGDWLLKYNYSRLRWSLVLCSATCLKQRPCKLLLSKCSIFIAITVFKFNYPFTSLFFYIICNHFRSLSIKTIKDNLTCICLTLF